MLTFAAALFVTGPAHAGPWVKDPGHLYTKVGYVRFSADEYVDPTGQRVEGVRYVGNTHHLYGEVGLLPNLQAVFNLPWVGARNVIDDVAFINRWSGDAEVGLALGRREAELPVALGFMAKVPLNDNADLLKYGNVASNFPAMGDGQVDLSVIASVGHGLSVGAYRGWVAGDLGYRHRTEWWLGDSSEPDRSYLDGLPWRAQLGWSPSPGDRSAWVSLEAGGIKNIDQDTVTKQYATISGSGGIELVKGLSAEAGYSHTVWARASSPGASVSTG